jgi:hypothetical protein
VEAPGEQVAADILGDGRGGAFVVWNDPRAGTSELDVYLQRVNATGEIAWRADFPSGRPLCTAPGRQLLTRLSPDGAGGVIATWHDERGGSPDIFAQRVSPDGTLDPSWPIDGAAVCTAGGTQTDPVIAFDGSGGAYIAWEDFRNGFANGRIFAQHMIGDGSYDIRWPADGIQIANGTGLEFQPAILPDGSGGAFVIWVRYWRVGTNTDLIAARITPSGTIAPGWPDSGLVVCAAPGRQDSPSLVSDRKGGFYAVWRDYRTDPDSSDIYCQRVTALGGFPPGWGGDGIAVRTAPGDEQIPKAAPDGTGGVLIAWENRANGLENVFVQRVTADATVAPGWDPAGVATGTATAEGQSPALVGDGAGGAIVAWDEEHPSTLRDVYAQHISAGGTRDPGWPSAGLPIASAPDQQQIGSASSALLSTIVGDGSGGAVLAWTDRGAPGGADVFVQRITAQGVAGPSSCAGCDPILGLAPNPGAGRVRIEVKSPDTASTAVLRVYDVAGRLLRTSQLTGLPPLGEAKRDLNLTDLPSGIYFLRYTTTGANPIEGTRQLTIVK